MKYVYTVTVFNFVSKNLDISQECYESFEDAVKFIESRTDKPKQIDNNWIWESSHPKSQKQYMIEELKVIPKRNIKGE